MQKLFSDSMNPSADSYKVIMYHGVGGIGKSSLKKNSLAYITTLMEVTLLDST